MTNSPSVHRQAVDGSTIRDLPGIAHVTALRTEHTGGNVYVTYVDLDNGRCLAVNHDGVWLYPNPEEADKGGESVDFMGFEQDDYEPERWSCPFHGPCDSPRCPKCGGQAILDGE